MLPYLAIRISRHDLLTRFSNLQLYKGRSPIAKRFLPQQFGAVCGNDSSRLSMHLRSRCLPRPSASSPLDNRAHSMANTGQALDLEGLHCEIHSMAEQMRVMNENNARLIQLLATVNPPPLAAPPIPDVEQSHRSHRSGDHSQNHNTGRERRDRCYSPSLVPPRRERSLSSSESKLSSKTPRAGDGEVRRERSPHKNAQTQRQNMSTSQKIRDLDARLDAINTRAGIPVTVDTLGSARSWFRKLPPRIIDSFGDLSRLFLANFMSYRIRQKNASHLYTIHQKKKKHLKDYVRRFNQAILEVEDPSDKVVIMAIMEGLRLGPLFDSLSKNVPKTLSALQNKADKYIAAEELAEAKRRRRGKDDPKRKEPDSRRSEYRDEARNKRFNRDLKTDQ
ncbi:hypothetical protein Acr_00g0074860 [Actinidia rufa]|uniref:Retrotransposon gag domain-containing protein n=1 Tax=Actinidia rufa TaxID=165716 RepID=A0A7J0DSV8_9ERIC|nr:hypothetical protein Acr_00g0074860 [Actinidia rufa]